MDRFQLRRDTAARWAEVNPILLEGEVGFETDTKRRKIGDGVHRWNVLEYLAAENIVQETGDSDKVVMSQKAVTEKLSELGSKLNNPQLSAVDKWVLSGYYINSTGGIESEYYGWNSFWITPIGLATIRVLGLTDYNQARVCFYNEKVSENNLISMVKVSSEDTGIIPIPKCDVIVVSYLTTNLLKLEFNYTSELLEYESEVSFIEGIYITTDGSDAEHKGYAATDYIELDGKSISYSITIYNSSGIVLYDTDKVLVGIVNKKDGSYTGELSVDYGKYPTAKYVRFVTTKSALTDSFVKEKRNDIDYVFKKTINNEENIKRIHSNIELLEENIESIDRNIQSVEYTDKYEDTYLDIKKLVLTPFDGITTYRYSVLPNTKYRVNAKLLGGNVVSIVSLESSNGSFTALERGTASDLKVVDKIVETRKNTAYIVICQSKEFEEPLVINTYIKADEEQSDKTDAWSQMSDTDRTIEGIFPGRVLNARKVISALYDYNNIYIVSNFIKPSLNQTVIVSVNNVEKINVDTEIAVGNLRSYDKYHIESIEGNNLTIRLIGDMSPYYKVGDTVSAILNTAYEGKEEIQEYSSYIYEWGDIKSLMSDNIPSSATTDNIHPTDAVYELLGKSISESIRILMKGENRIVVYGDSWGKKGIYPSKIQEMLGVEVLNKSRSGDSTMYIRKRFIEDFENGIVSNQDFFVIQMGTNNLYRLGEEEGNQFIGPVGQIMNDYKYHFIEDCKKITSLLKGNFLIIPGHAGADRYNPDIPAK